MVYAAAYIWVDGLPGAGANAASVTGRLWAPGDFRTGRMHGANNVVGGIARSEAWFRYAFLAWSSGPTWVLHNTADQRGLGTGGIYLHEGGADRGTRWGALRHRNDVIVGNLIVGAKDAVRSRPEDTVVDNASDPGRGDRVRMRDAPTTDARGRLRHARRTRGATVGPSRLLTHDHDGLLRFPGEPRWIGAHRRPPTVAPVFRGALIEAEYADGSMVRRYPTVRIRTAKPQPR